MDKQTQKNLLELVRRNYKEIAPDFDVTRKKVLWPEVFKLAEMVRDGDKVLDVGCGNGRLAEGFRDKKIKYLGVDNSEKLIERARKNFQFSIFNFQTNPNFQFSNKTQNVRFIVGDILELDKIPEKDFDYIFCIAVLHHLPGEELRLKALEQLKDKLKPASASSARGGKIILTVWNLWSWKKFKTLILKYGLLKLTGRSKMDFGDILFDWKNNQGEEVSQRYYYGFTKNELKKLAIRVGFKIEKLYKDRYNYYIILTK